MFYRTDDVIVPAGFITFGAVNFSALYWYRRFLGVPGSKAVLLWLVALVSAIALFVYQVMRIPNHLSLQGSQIIDAVAALTGCGCLPFFAAAFVAKLHLKWIGGLLTEQEKTPGPDAVRAWLSVPNLSCALILSVCASFGYGYSFWGVFAVTVVALLAYPAVHFVPGVVPPPTVKNETPSPERERILKLLEEGKITAQESATLLSALGQEGGGAGAQVTPARRPVLIGAAMVLVGFFLPWFSFNPANEVNRQMQSVLSNLPQQLPVPDMQLPFKLKMDSLSINGGDIPNGLGWMVLMLGMGAAILAYAATAMDAHTRRLLTLVCLGAGTVILLYLLTQSFRFASLGIILVLAGYALQFLGTIKDPIPKP